MKRSFSLLIACLLFITFTSCESKFYEEHQDVQKRDVLTWDIKDVKTFTVDIADNQPKFNLGIALRHHVKVVHKSVNVKLTTTAPSGKKTSKNYTIALKDPQDKTVGETAGDIADVTSFVVKDHTFAEKGKYAFEVALASKLSLTGFMSVGFIVDKVEVK